VIPTAFDSTRGKGSTVTVSGTEMDEPTATDAVSETPGGRRRNKLAFFLPSKQYGFDTNLAALKLNSRESRDGHITHEQN
jgi:hypothetical protein